MSLKATALALILAALAYLVWNGKHYDTPASRAEKAVLVEAQTRRYQGVSAKVSAMPGFTVPSGQSAGIMRIVTTQPLSDYEARKFCQLVSDQIGPGIMVRLVDDTGAILATRF